jgi:hypothetical protein
MTKEAFDEQLDILKGLSFEKFYDILEYRVDELEPQDISSSCYTF